MSLPDLSTPYPLSSESIQDYQSKGHTLIRGLASGEELKPYRDLISAETAEIVTNMMVAVVRDGLDGNASVPGYTIAGKTGTAEIPSPVGYEPGVSIVSFIGFLPADDPQVSILIKLDRPSGYWGSQVAAPVFRRLAERLVILLKIPPP